MKQHLTATVKSVTDIEGPGGWTAIVSSPSVDRDDEIIDRQAFMPLPAQVPVHDRHGGDLIGSARPYYLGDDLYVDGVFASTEKAQMVRTLVAEEHLSTMSVVFITNKSTQRGGRKVITNAELLAVDWAPIPSNRDTRVLAMRSVQDEDEEDLRVRMRVIELTAKAALAGSVERYSPPLRSVTGNVTIDACIEAYGGVKGLRQAEDAARSREQVPELGPVEPDGSFLSHASPGTSVAGSSGKLWRLQHVTSRHGSNVQRRPD